MNVAIIPARGGSKRIPKKNVKIFHGRPMIEWPIKEALASGVFDKVVVSTDSQEIADVARVAGAEVPFMRPPELSDDYTPTAPVIVHALEFLQQQNIEVEYACCIYATTPFIRKEFLRLGVDKLQEHGASSAVSVTSFPFPIYRALKFTEAGFLQWCWPEYEMTRSQDLPEAYHDAGQFYWLDCKHFMEVQRLYNDDTVPVVLPRHLVQDLDTLEDWCRAEYMMKAMELREGA